MNVENKISVAAFSSPVSLCRVFLAEWKWWLSGALISFELASVLMTGWPSGLLPNMSYPYIYSGDGLSYSWVIQRAIEGWFFDNPRSGYPFGSNFLDFPGSDSGNFLILKLIGLSTGEYYSAINLYYLLGFSITFISAFCVLRAIRLVRPLALSSAALFSFLPFHFLRLEHLFLTWYFMVPIFYYLALKMFSLGYPIEETKSSIPRKIFYAFSLIILASFGVYYALFGVILFIVVALAGINDNYNPRVLKAAFAAISMVTLGVLLNIAPNLVHQYADGANPEVAHMSAADAEVYGFKFAQLILPWPNHRNTKLRNISENYSKATPLVNENISSSLGIVGSLGFLALFGLIFSVLSGRNHNKTLRIISLIVVVLFMFGTIGGFGSVFAQVISPSIRGWNRISVFIGFGALLGFFMLLQMGLQKYFVGKRFLYLSSAISIMILWAGLYDQTPASCKACNEKTQMAFHMDREFIQAIEKSLPKGGAVYQLPYMPFPEAPPLYRLQSYDLAAGFLHSSALRWSYAGMRGRSGDLFYRSLAKESVEKQLEVIKRLGFAGVYIDRRGFDDNGKAVIEGFTDLLGAPPTLVRADSQVVFFSLNQTQQVKLDGLSTEQIMKKTDYIVDHLGKRYSASLAQGIDFTRPDFPSFIKDVQGLSVPESWGRWSDANLSSSVRIDFQGPLPNRFYLVFSGQPFGPNSDQDLEVRIGSKTHHFKMLAEGFKYRKAIYLGGEKVARIEFLPSHPASPRQLGVSSDDRKLGVGLVKLSIEN
jgi:phosphoglycerol transferase